jgi:hypothetical protein
MMNSKGLSTEPWCTLTLNLNGSLKPLATRSGQRALVYILCTTSLTIHSGTPSIHIGHQITFLGTLSNAFSKTTKAMYRFWFAPRYYACSWRTTKMASVIPRYGFNYLYCLSSSLLYLQNIHNSHSSFSFNNCVANFSLVANYICHYVSTHSVWIGRGIGEYSQPVLIRASTMFMKTTCCSLLTRNRPFYSATRLS